MRSNELIKAALEELSNLTPDQVKRISREKGIFVPPSSSYTYISDYFMFDLNGLFKEVINSYHKGWIDASPIEERRPVTVDGANKGFITETLSFFLSSADA